MEDRYECPACGSDDVWFDFAIDAFENPNTGQLIEAITEGERGGYIKCDACDHTAEGAPGSDLWKVTP